MQSFPPFTTQHYAMPTKDTYKYSHGSSERLQCREAVKLLGGRRRLSKIPVFDWKLQFDHKQILSYSPWSDRLTFFHLRKWVKIPKSKWPFRAYKWKWYSLKGRAVNSQLKNFHMCFSSKKPPPCFGKQQCFMHLFFCVLIFTPRVLKKTGVET